MNKLKYSNKCQSCKYNDHDYCDFCDKDKHDKQLKYYGNDYLISICKDCLKDKLNRLSLVL